MWVNPDVNMPQTLITAQREGSLVVFAGAGVSMGAPSNLPGYDELAGAIAAGSVTRQPQEPSDRFLGRAEQQGVDVQGSCRLRLQPDGSEPTPLHRSILELFASYTTMRVVTTNFDRHFETVRSQVHPHAETYFAPALPLGGSFDGVVYLHGHIDRRAPLVITDGDFGRAYLTEGWATRFLTEMFRAYAVLFIGYSHEDPVMRYLARAFSGPTDRFAFCEPGREDYWRQHGITPIRFPPGGGANRFSTIPEALSSWSALARMGVLDHGDRVRELVALPPPLDPELLDYLRFALGHESTLQVFTNEARSHEWLEWADKEGYLKPLVDPSSEDDGRIARLSWWLAEKFAVSHAKHALAFVQRHGGRMQPQLSSSIIQVLLNTDDLTQQVAGPWVALFVGVQHRSHSRLLSRLLERCLEKGFHHESILLLNHLLNPILVVRDSGLDQAGEDEMRISSDVRLVGDEHHLRQAWKRIRESLLPEYRSALLPMASALLRHTHSPLRVSGNARDTWDPHDFRRSAIEPHQQDGHPDDWELLVDIARDCIEQTLALDAAAAVAITNSWLESGVPLLRRLAVHATGCRNDLSGDELLALVVERGWLYEHSLKHELFVLLRRAFTSATEAQRHTFLEYSLAQPVLDVGAEPTPETLTTVAYERYNLACWLAKAAPASEAARNHRDVLDTQNPEFGPREHMDLDVWIGGGFVGVQSPTTSQALLRMTPADAATKITDYADDVRSFGGPNREGLLTTFQEAAAESFLWSIDVAAEFIERDYWDSGVWRALVSSWISSAGDPERSERVVDLLSAHPRIGITCSEDVLRLLEERIDKKRDRGRIRNYVLLALNVLQVAEDGAPGVTSDTGTEWLTSAINHSGGRAAMVVMKALSAERNNEGDAWSGFSPLHREWLSHLLEVGGHRALLARVVLASQVHFLHSVDDAWVRESMLLWFDWERDAEQAAQAWNGFLAWGTWNAALFEDMLPSSRKTFSRMELLGDDRRSFAARLAAVAALSPKDPWRDGGWLAEFVGATAEEDRAEWATTFAAAAAESLDIDAAHRLWERWVSDYWQSRIIGTPAPLTDGEREAMVGWVFPFAGDLDAVVERIRAARVSPRLDQHLFYRLEHQGLTTSHAEQVGQLLRVLLGGAEALDYGCDQGFRAAATCLGNGADPAVIRDVAEQLARVGCVRQGEELQRRAEG